MNNSPTENISTILLVEDEDQQREVLTMLLEAEGYKVRGASSAEEVLKELGGLDFQLFISDVKLTGVDGFTFFSEVRKQPRFQNIPFIFISAYNDKNVIETITKHNLVDYVTKPYNLEDIISVVKKYLPSV
jgi:CheY-like chemotaxis protein